MTEPIATPPTGDVPPGEAGEMLQFDQAEFATPAADHPTCAVCHQPIPDEYYEINQKIMCPRCRAGVEAAFRGGSGIARFLKAAVLGILASIVGAIVYFAFVRATGANWSLISIIVGLMVGKAVRRGTGNRGGRLYQFMAVFLTYSSIVAMNASLVIEEFAKHAGDRPAAGAAKGGQGAKPDGGADAEKAAAGKGEAGGRVDPPKFSDFLQALVILIGFYTIPVQEVFQSPIAGLIYGFALWEAWKINHPIQLVFNGPFRLGDAAGGPEEVVHES